MNKHPKYTLKYALKIGLVYCCFLVFHLCFISPASANDGLNNFKHISTSIYFSLNPVTDIAQDSKGRMWFGTRNGLVRYDGDKLAYIKNDSFPKTNLNEIRDLIFDAKGKLYFVSPKHLSTYNPETNQFEVLTLPVAFDMDSDFFFNSLTVGIEGEIWLNTTKGILVYNEVEQTIRKVTVDAIGLRKENSFQKNVIYSSPGGDLWIGSRDGLGHYNGKESGNIDIISYPFQGRLKDRNVDINVLMADPYDRIWVGLEDGLYYLDKRTGKVHNMTYLLRREQVNTHVRALTLDDQNRLWVGTFDGIAVIDLSFEVTVIKHNSHINSLSDNKIRSLFSDNAGSIWVGTYYGGVNYRNRQQLNFSKIDDSGGSQLSYKVVSSMVQTESGRIYFGTDGKGLTYIDKEEEQYHYIHTINDSVQIKSVKSLLVDPQNRLWVGTFNEGLFCISKEGDIRQVALSPSRPFSPLANRIISLENGPNGKIWLGTLTRGVSLLDPQTNTVREIQLISLKNSNLSNVIRILHMKDNGELLVGTSTGIGILTLPPSSSEQAHVLPIYVRDNEQMDVDIQDIYQDYQGEIWVGTIDHGLFKVEGNHLVSQGLESITTVYAIQQDVNKTFWLSSNEGIARYNPENKVLQIYGDKQGGMDNEFNKSSKLLSREGKIYFGGASGVTTFYPNELVSKHRENPKVLITGLQVEGRAILPRDSSGILDRSIEFVDHIRLSHQQGSFTLNFAIPNYIDATRNKFMYRLKGLDESWQTSSLPFVSYTIQNGGDYTFQIKSVSGEGFATGEITELSIEVQTPLWKRWWMILIYISLVAMMIAAAAYIYLSRLQFRHKLEIQTRDAMNEQIEHKNKIQFFTNVSHEFRTPLTLISGPLERILEEYKGPHKLYMSLLNIKKNSDQLYKLVDELLDFTKFEHSRMKLEASQQDIVPFVRGLYETFVPLAKCNKIDYTFQSSDKSIVIPFDMAKLEKVIYNLISNAFKYTPNKGRVSVSITPSGEYIALAIQDSGIGMEEIELDHIFERYYEVPDGKINGRYKSASGIGLAIVRDIMELHQGKVSVTSTKDSGSVFTVFLPLLHEDFLDLPATKDKQPKEQKRLRTIDKPTLAGSLVDQNPVVEDQKEYTLLLVEDNPEMARFITDVLKPYYTVIWAQNGLEGYKIASLEQPDLVVSDVVMPKLGGIKLGEKLKGNPKTSHIPLILLTGNKLDYTKIQGLESGAVELLFKPFDIKELLMKCQNILANQHHLKEKISEKSPAMEKEVLSEDDKLKVKAFGIIDCNLSNEQFTVDQFGEDLGVSRTILYTKFKAWTNQTPKEWILQRRMKKAAMLIESNKCKISEVGYQVGFKDPSYFTKSFKKFFGLGPKEYAEKFKDQFIYDNFRSDN
ncbi:hybrid sensor histidine kinase/response regulator [Echinicola pacifica]|uniref:histidine kinase n=1 Tax=Echinicola pacifica TaxID=346377 RepID=A0A918PYF0_9BACT|nr:two-component regulator propeller domain-containing protein [Echinicola pacifica]GGZ25101.1 hybrid sensor histidine kinase/response regulator [Echinicola pacifica]